MAQSDSKRHKVVHSGSRYNSVKFATHVEGPMPCPGTHRCKVKHCNGDASVPSVGSLCWWEAEYARHFLAEFHERWAVLTITPDAENLDELAREALAIDLQRTRCITRLNHASILLMEGDRTTWETADREIRLSNLYLDRLTGRQDRLEAELEAGIERMRQRAERLSGGK